MNQFFQSTYFSFKATGIMQVDAILRLLAETSKKYHNTSDWDCRDLEYDKQKTPILKIQEAANEIARVMRLSEKLGKARAFKFASEYADRCIADMSRPGRLVNHDKRSAYQALSKEFSQKAMQLFDEVYTQNNEGKDDGEECE